MLERILDGLKQCAQVEAIAIGGSRAGTHFDEKSDYDVYVYSSAPVPVELRQALYDQTCREVEIGNSFWEYEDNGTLNNGIDFDIVYRNLDDFMAGVSAVADRCEAHNGYTTCMWYNLIHCKIVYDRDGRLKHCQETYTIPYPEQLKKNIIERNLRLLRHSQPAYSHQIAKAVKRKDLVSVNHRTAEFLASYFDIIFARNGLLHPGEKRLVELCRANCAVLPADFEQNLQMLFDSMFREKQDCTQAVERIIDELEAVLD